MDTQELINNKKFVEYVINKCVPMQQMFNLIDMEYSDEYNIYCPFHENTDTPAGKIYHNKDGIDTLFCFAEHKVFRAVDFIKHELVNYRMESIFYKIWRQLNEEQKKVLIELFNNSQDDSISTIDFSKNDVLLKQFREGKIDYNEFCQILYRTIL